VNGPRACRLHDALLRTYLPLQQLGTVDLEQQPNGPEHTEAGAGGLPTWGGLPWPAAYAREEPTRGGLSAMVLVGRDPLRSPQAAATTATAYRALAEAGCPDTVLLFHVAETSGGGQQAVLANMQGASWSTDLGTMHCDPAASKFLREAGLPVSSEDPAAAVAEQVTAGHS
jgi:hypothetical protein